MSGFVAVLAGRGREVGESLLRRLAAPLAARGPDGAGSRREGGLAMAHTLLRTRTGATAGPHRSARGAWLAGDVRLVARDDLVRSLAASGAAVPAIDDDDALVLAAWDAWGESMTARIRGEYSFALWDPARRTLFCARDPFGVRLLYWAERGNEFVCSNVLAAVLAHPAVGTRLHEPAVVSYLHEGWNVEPDTTSFADVRRLPPAHQFAVSSGGKVPAPSRHWTFPTPELLRDRRAASLVDEYRDVFAVAVRDRVRMPRAAVMLSGGLDSTSLLATARRIAPDVSFVALTGSVARAIPDDDPRLAALVAGRAGASHVVIDTSPIPLAHLADAAAATPEPFDEADHAAWRGLAARAGEHAPVLFSGEDADALLHPPGLATMLRTRPLLGLAASLARYTAAHVRLPHIGLGLRRRVRTLFRRREAPAPCLRPEVVRRVGIPDEPALAPHRTRPMVQARLLGSVWQSLLESNDHAYSGAAVEVQWPFLDTRVLEFALAIPPIPWCQGKELLRAAFREELPPEVIRRPKTTLAGYHPAQVARWRAAGAPRQRLSDATAAFVDPAQVDAYLAGSTEQVYLGWRVLQLDRWMRAR